MAVGCGLCKYGGKKRITHKRKHKGSRSNKSKLNKVSHVGGKQRKTHSKKYKLRSTKKKYSGGAAAIHAAEKTWVCRGNIGCARNINIYK